MVRIDAYIPDKYTCTLAKSRSKTATLSITVEPDYSKRTETHLHSKKGCIQIQKEHSLKNQIALGLNSCLPLSKLFNFSIQGCSYMKPAFGIFLSQDRFRVKSGIMHRFLCLLHSRFSIKMSFLSSNIFHILLYQIFNAIDCIFICKFAILLKGWARFFFSQEERYFFEK